MKIRLEAGSQDFLDARNHVYGLAHNICINGKEQTKLINVLHDGELELMKQGVTGRMIIKLQIAVIQDVLKTGKIPDKWYQTK